MLYKTLCQSTQLGQRARYLLITAMHPTPRRTSILTNGPASQTAQQRAGQSPMPTFGLSYEIQVAQSLARQAGQVVMQHYHRMAQMQQMHQADLGIEYKNQDPHNPVTPADREANALIVAGLQNAFPADAILAEESPPCPSRLKKSRLWCVDPLDGTREFIAHTGQFVVMIGLAIEGAARLGVIYQPTEDRLQWGVEDQAWLEHLGHRKRLHVSNQTDFHQAVWITSRAHASATIERLAQGAGAGKRQRLGSIGLKLAYLAEGTADIYMSTASFMHAWDACAPEALVKAAQGHVSTVHGQPLRYNQEATLPTGGLTGGPTGGMVATNGHLHEACLMALKPWVCARA